MAAPIQGGIFELHRLTDSEESALEFLRTRHCLRRAAPSKLRSLSKIWIINKIVKKSHFLSACPIVACGRVMTWIKVQNGQTTHCWHCPSHTGRKVWPRSGSFFENSRLPLRKILSLIWCWAKDMSNKQTIELTGISGKIVINWFKVGI